MGNSSTNREEAVAMKVKLMGLAKERNRLMCEVNDTIGSAPYNEVNVKLVREKLDRIVILEKEVNGWDTANNTDTADTANTY